MALTYTPVKDATDVWGRTRVEVFDLTLDDAYPTGGYVINAQDVGLKSIYGAEVVGGDGDQLALMFGFKVLASPGDLLSAVNLLAYFPTGGATAGTTLSAPTSSVTSGTVTLGGTATGSVAAGATPVTSSAANGAIVSVPSTGLTATLAAGAGTLVAGVAKQVANSGDLGTIVLRVRFTGR